MSMKRFWRLSKIGKLVTLCRLGQAQQVGFGNLIRLRNLSYFHFFFSKLRLDPCWVFFGIRADLTCLSFCFGKFVQTNGSFPIALYFGHQEFKTVTCNKEMLKSNSFPIMWSLIFISDVFSLAPGTSLLAKTLWKKIYIYIYRIYLLVIACRLIVLASRGSRGFRNWAVHRARTGVSENCADSVFYVHGCMVAFPVVHWRALLNLWSSLSSLFCVVEIEVFKHSLEYFTASPSQGVWKRQGEWIRGLWWPSSFGPGETGSDLEGKKNISESWSLANILLWPVDASRKLAACYFCDGKQSFMCNWLSCSKHASKIQFMASFQIRY